MLPRVSFRTRRIQLRQDRNTTMDYNPRSAKEQSEQSAQVDKAHLMLYNELSRQAWPAVFCAIASELRGESSWESRCQFVQFFP